MNSIETAALMGALKELSMAAVDRTEVPVKLEAVERATYHTGGLIQKGVIRDETEMKLVFASFADGFCTGRGYLGAVPS